MLTYRIEKDKYKTDYPPRGSFHADGRWHRRNMWVVYTAENIALAKLEILANTVIRVPGPWVLRTFEIQSGSPMVDIQLDDLPWNWNSIPYPSSLANMIDLINQKRKYVAVRVPSVQSVNECNVLLLPDCPEFQECVREHSQTPEAFDPRLIRN